jgi:hypothetical protein
VGPQGPQGPEGPAGSSGGEGPAGGNFADAPADGTHYVRINNAWQQCIVVSVYNQNDGQNYNCLTVI